MKKINKAKINEKQVKQLLTLVEKGSQAEKQALFFLMERYILPFHLCQLEDSTDETIQKYVKARIKKLYTVKKSFGSFEKEFAKRLDVLPEELDDWGDASEKELFYYKRDSENVINGLASEFEVDATEAIELIKHNINLSLTSPSPYIRTLAEFILAKKEK